MISRSGTNIGTKTYILSVRKEKQSLKAAKARGDNYLQYPNARRNVSKFRLTYYQRPMIWRSYRLPKARS
jgi:hypothetical protein